jgi:hypothetical protein
LVVRFRVDDRWIDQFAGFQIHDVHFDLLEQLGQVPVRSEQTGRLQDIPLLFHQLVPLLRGPQ